MFYNIVIGRFFGCLTCEYSHLKQSFCQCPFYGRYNAHSKVVWMGIVTTLEWALLKSTDRDRRFGTILVWLPYTINKFYIFAMT